MNSYSYQMYEMAHAALAPARAWSDATRLFFKNPMNPFAHMALGKNMAASAELFERVTRRYGKPIFGLDSVDVNGGKLAVIEQVIWERPFCKLLHFQRLPLDGGARPIPVQPKLLIVAPMSGHYATLLRGTVEAFLPSFDVYITDWADARMVPQIAGDFDLDDYIDYLMAMLHVLGKGTHTLGVCQPAVPLLLWLGARSLEQEKTGAPAILLVHGDKDDMIPLPALFSTALGSYLRSIEEVLNRHLLPRLWKLNNFDPAMMPEIKASDVESPDLGELGTYIKTLTDAGAPIFPDDNLEDHLRDVANLPDKAPTAMSTMDLQAKSTADNAPPPAEGKLGPDGKPIVPAKQPKPKAAKPPKSNI